MASDTRKNRKKTESGPAEPQTKINKKQLVMRIGAALILLILLAGVLLPLYNPGSPVKRRKTVMTVNSHDISSDEFEYILSNEISTYVYYYGGQYFANKANMSDLLNYIKEEITFYYAFLDWAEENGFALDQGQKDTIRAELDESKAQFETEEEYQKHLNSIYATEEVLYDTECMFECLNNYYDYLTDPENGPYAESARALAKDPEAFNIYGAKHILFLFDEEGRATEETKALAEDVLSQVRNGGDFDELMKQYCEDPGIAEYPDGYTFTQGEMVDEFYSATAALGIGEVSDLVMSTYGYHIIKRVEPDEDEAAQKIVMNLYGAAVDSRVDEAEVKLSRGYESIEYTDFRISEDYPVETSAEEGGDSE